MRSSVLLAVALSSMLVVGCNSGDAGGGGENPDSGVTTPTGPKITIQNYAYSPAELTVDAGTTISIVNLDTMAHTVTSEAADNDFTPGAVQGVSFDSGQVAPSSGGTAAPGPYGYSRAATAGASITIPATAPSGTVIPYYCSNHTSTMATPNGHITVR